MMGERCLQHVTLEDLIKTGNLIPERKYIILGIRKKSKMDEGMSLYKQFI